MDLNIEHISLRNGVSYSYVRYLFVQALNTFFSARKTEAAMLQLPARQVKSTQVKLVRCTPYVRTSTLYPCMHLPIALLAWSAFDWPG